MNDAFQSLKTLAHNHIVTVREEKVDEIVDILYGLDVKFKLKKIDSGLTNIIVVKD